MIFGCLLYVFFARYLIYIPDKVFEKKIVWGNEITLLSGNAFTTNWRNSSISKYKSHMFPPPAVVIMSSLEIMDCIAFMELRVLLMGTSTIL